MIEGHNEAKVDNYRLTRMLMFTMVRLLGDSKTAPKTPEALWQLPGDESNEITDADIAELFKRLG